MAHRLSPSSCHAGARWRCKPHHLTGMVFYMSSTTIDMPAREYRSTHTHSQAVKYPKTIEGRTDQVSLTVLQLYLTSFVTGQPVHRAVRPFCR